MRSQYCKLCIVIMIILLAGSIPGGTQQKNLKEIFDHVIYTGEPIASSELVEKGLPKDYYSAKKAVDGKVETAWVEGVEGDGVGEYIIFDLNIATIPTYEDFSENQNKYLEFEINIINGVAKNKKIFKLNNRIKVAILEIYEAEVNIRQIDPWIRSEQEPIINSSFELHFRDTMEQQKFKVKIRPKQKPIYGLISSFSCIGKLVIKEIYPGEKYRDTGISEIKVIHLDED